MLERCYGRSGIVGHCYPANTSDTSFGEKDGTRLTTLRPNNQPGVNL